MKKRKIENNVDGATASCKKEEQKRFRRAKKGKRKFKRSLEKGGTLAETCRRVSRTMTDA